MGDITGSGKPGHYVFLIHGIFDTGNVFDRMSANLEAQGMATIRPDLVPNDGSERLEQLAYQLQRRVESMSAVAGRVSLVGFSMGGLISRYYMQRMGGHQHVQRWATISSPHHGTLTAYLRDGPGVRQMRFGSAFLSELNRDVETLRHIPFLSLRTPFDAMVCPPDTSILPIGANETVRVLAHDQMLRDERVIERVVRFLS